MIEVTLDPNGSHLLNAIYYSTATEQVVCSKHRVWKKSHVIICHSYLFIVCRPSLVSNVESNVLDMTNLRCETERELSMVAQRASLGGNKRPRRQYFEKLGPLP